MIKAFFPRQTSRVVFVILCLVSFLAPVFGSDDSCMKGPPRRVLLITGNLIFGGIEKAFIDLVNCWAVPNTDVEILLLGRGGALEPLLRKDFPIISSEEAFCRSYDVAACFLGWGVDPRKCIAKTCAKRRVQWVHTDLLACPFDHFFRHADWCQGIDAFAFVSEKASESARQIQPQWKDKIFTILNVLDGNLIKKRSLEETECFPSDGICNVVSVGRLTSEKGFDRAVRVHRRLNQEGINFRWFIVGDGIERHKIKKRIARYNLQGKCILLGAKVNPYPFVAQSDIFVVPSYFEGWCLAATEAKILGRPIVFTDVAGAREQFESGKNGLIVENSEEGIYEGLKSLLLDESLRLKFTEALQDYEYDNASIYKDIEKLFFPHEVN